MYDNHKPQISMIPMKEKHYISYMQCEMLVTSEWQMISVIWLFSQKYI